MSDPFAPASESVGISYDGIMGALLLISPKHVQKDVATQHGITDAVSADVVVLDGDQADTVYGDTLVFPRKLQAQIRNQLGGMVLGRLGKGVAQPGKQAPWQLAPPTEDDKKIARAHLAKNTELPF